MVHKIKIILFLLLLFVLSFFAISQKGNVETNLLKTLLPQNIGDNSDLIAIANKSSSVIKVVLESDNEKNISLIYESFISGVDKDYFEYSKPDVSILIDKYISHPMNFISDKTRILLEQSKFDEIYNLSMQELYNPIGIQLTSFEKEPFMLTDDYIKSLGIFSSGKSYINGKYYDYISIKIKSDEGLSPDTINKKIGEIVKLKNNLSKNGSKIYLSGTPIHSYYTSIRSIISINLICILSTILIIFLTYYYFKNIKLLLPIILSIMFGMLSGYIATRLIFENFQVITMVFSTTLIGIGIDYSYHYFFSDTSDKLFVKNLSISLMTSVIPFILLYLTGIELLKQVAVFTVFGLIAIYLTVLFIYPAFEYKKTETIVKINTKVYCILLLIICFISLLGFFRFKFNDSLAALYTPSKSLQKVETLYNKISGDNSLNTQIITVKSDNLKNIISIEEGITYKLAQNDFSYMSLSKLMPSISRQEDNFKLVKKLYSVKLKNYSDILSTKQIETLLNSKFMPAEFDIKDNNFINSFLLYPDTSIIYVFSDKNIELNENNAKIINFKSDIENYLKSYRKALLSIFPIVILVLGIILTLLYDFKKSLRLMQPSIIGIICSMGMASLFFGEINLFCVISGFLVLGFTFDYSIFRANPSDKTETAVFVSCLTTSFSFFLLSLCGFKLLSSMAFVIFWGIIISYLAGYFSLKDDNI